MSEVLEVGGEPDEGGELGPRAQVMSTACWLTIKEASFLLGHLVQAAPLSGTAEAHYSSAIDGLLSSYG